MTEHATATPNRAEKVGRIIEDSLAEFRRAHPTRRHPAEVTADRLADATLRYDFSGEDRDAIARIIFRLREIAGDA